MQKKLHYTGGINGHPHPHPYNENLSMSHFGSFTPLALPAADPVPFCPPLTQQLPVELILYRASRGKILWHITQASTMYSMFYIYSGA